MLSAGIVILALTLGNAAMYYGEVLFAIQPLVQKISLALWVAWLLALHFGQPKAETHGINCA